MENGINYYDWKYGKAANEYKVLEERNIPIMVMEQIRDNVGTFQESEGLTDADAELLMKACEAFKNQICVPCTACRYCCDDCPKKINIPACLEIYNGYKTDGPWALGRLNSIDSEGKPSDCIGCGACAGHCPQSIRIPEIMSELAALSK